MEESGIQTPERTTPRLIVSLTSHPPRVAESYAAVYSLLTQSLKPDKVVLWLAQSQFPCKEHDLPWELLHLRQFGLSIQWCEDLKALKKIIPSLKAYPDDTIVLADDDTLYPHNWLEQLYEEHRKNPSFVQAYAAYKVCSGRDYTTRNWCWGGGKSCSPPYFASSWGGVLYPPHSQHEEVLRTDLAMQLAPYDDELWCWAMRVLKGTTLHTVKDHPKGFVCLHAKEGITERARGLDVHTFLLKAYPRLRKILIEDGYVLPDSLFRSLAGLGEPVRDI
jgi:hypothetical protein